MGGCSSKSSSSQDESSCLRGLCFLGLGGGSHDGMVGEGVCVSRLANGGELDDVLVDAFCLVTIDSNFCVRFFVASFVLERDSFRGSLNLDSVFFLMF